MQILSSMGDFLFSINAMVKMEEETSTAIKAEEASTETTTGECCNQKDDHKEEPKIQCLKQQMMVQQQIHIQVMFWYRTHLRSLNLPTMVN